MNPSNNDGFTSIVSIPLATLGPVGSSLAWDVMLPTQQPNPSWLGTAQMYLNSPTLNIFNAFLGQVELTGKPLNVWNTISFPLTNDQVIGLLSPGYRDLTVKIILNVQVPTTGTYRIDNLRFLAATPGGCAGKPNGTLCNDGNSCTVSDRCQAGVCQAGAPITCPAPDQCHTAGTCNVGTGVCSNPSKANGTTCNDGNQCTQTDKCQSGTCIGTPKANGTTCDDANVCTQTDKCQSGTCTGTPKANGTTCDDANACTQTDKCQTGICTGTPKANGTICNDANACTQADKCQTGRCIGGNPKACPPVDQCHTGGTCSPSTGLCSSPVKVNGTTCNDGNRCTLTDTCQTGSCVGANPKSCMASDQCHTAGTCDPPTGTCTNPTKPDGTSCNDSKACTTGEACQSGTCVKDGAPVICTVEAESFDVQAGMIKNATSVTPTQVGASVQFPGVDFGAPGSVDRLQVMLVGAQKDQHLELRLDAATGPLVADLLTLATDFQSPVPQSAAFLMQVSGIHRVVIVAGSTGVGAIDWFSLERGFGKDSVSAFPSTYRHQNPGQGLDFTNLPPTTGGGEEEDVPKTIAQVSLPSSIQILPGQTQFIQLRLTKPLAVVGQVSWTGVIGDIAISVTTVGGQTLATGASTSVPGGGQANIKTPILAPQTIRVQAKNVSTGTMLVKIVAGVLGSAP